MVVTARSNTRLQICLPLVFCLLFSLGFAVTAQAQTTTYHLHGDASLFQLKTAGPDIASLAVQSANLKNQPVGEYLIKAFDTQSGVPNASGVIPAGSTVTFSLWMNKTAASGVIYPRAKLLLNSATGTLFGTATGSTALTTTLTKYTFSVTTSSSISMTTADRFYLWAGVNVTTKATAITNASLSIEGTLNGNYDSAVAIPNPTATGPPPSITNVSPTTGSIGAPVTITGSDFGATQGTSTVTFNGTVAIPTGWSATSVVAPVPAGATSGPVVITVGGSPSNSVAFTVSPMIDSLSPNSGTEGTSFTVLGTNFGTTQASSTVTLNGTAAAPTSWSATSIVALVPAGATSGQVVVTVNGLPSNGVTFTVGDAGTLAGTITRASDGTGINGALIEALQSSVVKASVTSSGNGGYSIPSLIAGTYDVRASANRYETQVQPGVAVVDQSTTTVNFSLVDGEPLVYIYDESGRLVSVIDPLGETAIYRYDAVGNLVSISRQSSAQVSIIEFTPNSGQVGRQVTIYGTGFSATPSQNTVQFNGTTATVISAASTQILTSVPTGATTGPISVTTPTGNATSSASFVLGDTGAPTITNLTPTIGAPGTAVTITGTNFETTPSGNRVAFNGTRAVSSSSTATSIATNVPSGATSGKVSVTTPDGRGVSNADFFVPPSPYTAADVAVADRMAIGETKTVTIGAANKIAIILFDGLAGQRVSLMLSNVTIAQSQVTIMKPDGAALISNSYVTTSGAFFDTQTLPMSGSYTIFIDPASTNTGSITLSLYNIVDVVGTITPGGPAVTVTTTMPGQNARLTFNGTAGQRVSLGVSGITFAPGYCCDIGNVAIYNPDGTVLLSPFAFTNGGTGAPSQVLPDNGTYAIVLDPYSSYVGNVTLTLSEDLSVQVSINGPPVTLNFNPGQNARLTFDGTAGQRVSVGLSGITIGTGYCCDVGSVAFYKPDGSVLLSPLGFGTAGAGTLSQVLPVSGIYSIVIDPYLGRNGSATVTLSEDLSPPISINDPPVTLDFRVGQNARLTFDGTAGQRVSVGLSGITIGTGYCCDVGSVAFYKPDGSVLLSPLGFGTAGAGTPSQVLPVSGTYSIVIDPYLGRNGSATVTLSGDLAGQIEINGPPVTLDLSVGQNGRLTFDGTAGQRVSVGLTGITIGTGYCCDVGSVALYKPDGTVLLSPLGFGTAGAGTPSQVLPVSGPYSIVVDPYLGRSGSVTVTLSEDLFPPISIDGPSVPLDFRAGQNARLTFDGTAGQRVSVGLTGITIGTGYCCDVGSVSFYKPDGTVLLSPLGFGTAGAGTPSQMLPVSGTYSIVVDPYLGRSGSAAMTLSEDLSPPISINGPSVPLNFSAGQNARLTFDGVAGQRVSVGLAGITIGTGYCCDVGSVAFYKPDGSVLLSPMGFGTAGAGTPSQVLPVTGTYAIVVDPYLGRTGSATITLSEDLSPPITANGPSVPLDFRSGQNARLTFEGTADQRVSLGVNGVTIGTGYCCDVGSIALYKPDGSVQLSPLGFGTAGTSTATQVLPITGTYSIIVDPYLGRTGGLTLSLAEDLSGPISINGPPVTLQFTQAGQNARLLFSGNAGQWVSVGASDTTIGAPGCCTTSTVAIYKPDGTTLLAPFGFYQGGGGSPSVQLPTTGTYSLVVDPYGSVVGNVTITLSEDLSPPTSINGPAVILTNRAGQNGRLLFSGNAGQWVSVGASDTTIGAPSCCTTSMVSIIKPDGTTLLAPFGFYQVGGGTPSVQLPTTGTYSIVVDPYLAVSGNVTITLSEDLSPPISINGPPVILTNRAGQNGRLLFSGSAGQWVSVGASDTTIGAPSCCTTSMVSMYKPDGTTLLAPFGFYQAGAGTPSVQLPTTGTYSIVVDPYLAVAGNVTITLSEDLSPPISINGPAVILTNRAGQNGRLLFSGSAGQWVSVGAGDTTIGAPSCCTTSMLSMYKPDGTTLVAPLGFYQAGVGTPSVQLPTTGTYSIVVDPYLAVAGNVTITLSEDLSPPISINGPPMILTNRAGQNGRLLFSGTAGQWITLAASDTTIGAPSCCTTSMVAIYKPDGTTLLAPVGFYQAGLATASILLPTTGAYTIVLDPYLAVAGDVTLTLSEDLASPISINGSLMPLVFRTGQNASISFSVSASQQVTVRVTNNGIGAVTVKLLRPDGTTMTTTTSSGSSFNLTTQTLTVTGTYIISVDPNGTNSGSMSLSVTNP